MIVPLSQHLTSKVVLSFVQLQPLPVASGAWLSEAGLFSPTIWSREKCLKLGSQALGFSSHSARHLCVVCTTQPQVWYLRPRGASQAGSELASGAAGQTPPIVETPISPISKGPATLSAPQAQAESQAEAQSPQPLQGSQKPKSLARQVGLWEAMTRGGVREHAGVPTLPPATPRQACSQHLGPKTKEPWENEPMGPEPLAF